MSGWTGGRADLVQRRKVRHDRLLRVLGGIGADEILERADCIGETAAVQEAHGAIIRRARVVRVESDHRCELVERGVVLALMVAGGRSEWGAGDIAEISSRRHRDREISPRSHRDIEISPCLRRAEVSAVEPHVDASLRISYQALEPAGSGHQSDTWTGPRQLDLSKMQNRT